MSDSVDSSLRIGNPADGHYVVDAIRESGGWGETASNEEIIAAIRLLARTEGIWTETAGGVTLAATRKLIEQGRLPRDESIVVCVTGNGLKTVEAVADRVGAPVRIAPTLGAFEEKVLGAV
jgi:threonine synthase